MDPTVWIAGWVLILPIIGYVIHRISGRLDERTMPLMAVLAAGIFVAQMLNFPIGGGTSGHLLGAALATVILGPWAAMIIMTVILIIQALVFGDGGITALGLNILNMAVLAPLSAWFVLKLFGERHRTAGVPLAAWISTFLVAIACAAELALSFTLSGGGYGIIGSVAFPTMAVLYAIIGVGEAIITSSIILFLAKVSPEMLNIHKRITEKPVEG